MKKLAQVLDDDERIRDQLETLVSPSCSCKQAEICVVSSEPDPSSLRVCCPPPGLQEGAAHLAKAGGA